MEQYIKNLLKFGLCPICFILFFSQCKQTNTDSTYKKPNFPLSIERKFQKINNNFIIGPGPLYQVDSFLVINCETDINNKKIHFFSKHTGKYINSFGEIGDGPDQFSSMARISFDENNNTLYVCDLIKNKIFVYDYTKVINNKLDKYEKIELNEGFRNNTAFYSINTDFLVINPAFQNKLYRFVLGNKNDTISTYNYYPKLSEPNGSEYIEESYFLYSSHTAINQNGTKLVNATDCGCILELFDLSNKKITLITTNRLYKPQYYIKDHDSNYPYIFKEENSVQGIKEIKATDNYIYGVLNETSDSNNRKTIAVFDWKGNPIKKYILNCNILALSIDESLNKGYVISFNEEEMSLGSFEL